MSKTGNTENQTKSNFGHKYRKCILKIISKEENYKEFTVMIYFLQLKIFLLYWKMYSIISDLKHEGRKYSLCRHSLYNRIQKEGAGKAQSLQGGCESRVHLYRLASGHSATTVESTLQSVLQKWLHLNGKSFILKLGIRNLKEKMVQRFKIASFSFNTLYASLGNFNLT